MVKQDEKKQNRETISPLVMKNVNKIKPIGITKHDKKSGSHANAKDVASKYETKTIKPINKSEPSQKVHRIAETLKINLKCVSSTHECTINYTDKSQEKKALSCAQIYELYGNSYNGLNETLKNHIHTEWKKKNTFMYKLKWHIKRKYNEYN